MCVYIQNIPNKIQYRQHKQNNTHTTIEHKQAYKHTSI